MFERAGYQGYADTVYKVLKESPPGPTSSHTTLEIPPLTLLCGSQTLSTTGESGPLSVGVPPSLPVTTSQHAGSQDRSHGELCVGMC